MARKSGKRSTRSRSGAARSRSFLDIGPVRFARETYAELRRSHWPTQRETLRLTLIILGVCIMLATFLGAFDFGLSQLSDLVFR